jgi:methionyl-tRNA synthetase
MPKFYITTTLPYVNDRPHIGHVLEFVQADVIARYHRAMGDEVIFNVGTDEHGIKVYRKALEQDKTPQEFVDEYSKYFGDLKKQYNISFTNFIRTSDPDHISVAQEFWKICLANGDIYKKAYKVKYCIGCELEKTDSELVDDKCPIHPTLKIEELDEENYFFKFSKYQKKLLELYDSSKDFVLPSSRLKEIHAFVENGINDFSVSRLKSKLPWGISVPDDDEQVMYVWFDALINYISTLGWPKDKTKFNEFWPGVQIAGKDNLRQQSAIWQAMLISAGLPPSKQILIHGFITTDGQKMSKSVGNVIDPLKIADKYGIDPVRYYLLREIPSDEDGDFSVEKLEARYNGDLANNLGNLVSRLAKLIETKLDGELDLKTEFIEKIATEKIKEITDKYHLAISNFRLHEALADVWELLTFANQYIDENKPWSKDIEPDHLLKTLTTSIEILFTANRLLEPFLPETSEKILKIFGQTKDQQDPIRNSSSSNGASSKYIVGDFEPLFPRLK